jgi:small-conductance mechanosensitive channel
MGLHTLLPPTFFESSAEPTEADTHEEIIREQRRTMQALARTLDDRIQEGDCPPQVYRERISCASRIKDLTGELRQIEKHTIEAARKLTPPMLKIAILEQAKDLPPDLRADLAREIAELADEGALRR